MEELICKYCGKVSVNLNSHHNHETRCPLNLNKKTYKTGMKGKVSWSKGLTAKTDDRLRKLRENLKEGYMTGNFTFKGYK